MLSPDADFRDTVIPAEARRHLRRGLSADLGFAPDNEAFTAMLALAHLPRPLPERARHLPAVLARQIESGRWHDRYRFFPEARQFAADTDCTAVATAALYECRMLPRTRLRRHARELRRAYAPALPHDQALRPLAVMVYWDDGAEHQAPPRGHKQDAVVCCNVLYTLLLADTETGHETDSVGRATLDLVHDHLASGRYLSGTRYYPSPYAFLHTASRLCRLSPACAERLGTRLNHACDTADSPRTPLDLALLITTAENLGQTQRQGRRLNDLAALQLPDGSWPAQPYFRLGRRPLYFGSTHLTTLFALCALHP
ncbi:hypothetical protein AB0D14_32520 [Streptomyces sp. NPDC048484]|uniref:hypothetical protein n=1 Tax=Streptomyces sp. NPDC048484 TaxID=3155146 RepID=UPI0034444C08